MNYSFKILNNTYKTINYINKLLVNYPKKEVILRNNIEKNNYAWIESIFAFNINDSWRIKEKYLKDILIKLSMCEFYIKISYEKKIISKKKFIVVGNYLLEIRRMVYGLKKREESEQ